MAIALVTDSTADIPADLLEKYRIRVVPNILVIDGATVLDDENFSRQDFYRRLPAMKTVPTTAAASVGAYQELYEELLNQGAQQIVSIHTSSQLSGIYNSASTAAQDFENRIHVMDSETTTLGLGFQVLEAAEAILQGASLDSVLRRVEDVRRRVRVIAMLDTLEYIFRSGRVSWARARLGSLLSIKPFVDLRQGQVFRLGDARTRRNGIERLKELLKSLGRLERLAVLHTNAEADARQFLADVRPELSFPPLIVNITTVIGTHVGPNGLGFAVVVR